MNNKNISTQGIILKRINHKEADKILTIYTIDQGKIKCIAKGIRKITSKKKGHLELINAAKIELIKHGDWFIVTQAELIDSFENLKTDYEKLKHAYYILEVFDKLIPDDHSDILLYKFLFKTLKSLEISEINPKHIINAYSLKIIRMLGFYSNSSYLTVNPEIREYCDKLVSSKYEDVIQNSNLYTHNIINSAHGIICSKIEEVAEKDIKSLGILVWD